MPLQGMSARGMPRRSSKVVFQLKKNPAEGEKAGKAAISTSGSERAGSSDSKTRKKKKSGRVDLRYSEERKATECEKHRPKFKKISKTHAPTRGKKNEIQKG